MLLFSLLGAAPTLDSPIACEIGETCFIQQYVDHDPGEGATDFACGAQSYDGHKGTDFRVPDQRAMRGGVEVLASAAGRVIAIRDGEADLGPGDAPGADLQGRECGNGVVIDHGEEWQTQYCHLRKGSVRVAAGDEVAAGDVLGLVGQSGKAAFPHVHLSVRHGARAVDPFAPRLSPGECGMAAGSLWGSAVGEGFAYDDARILNAGFAGRAVKMADIEAGAHAGFGVSEDTPALVVFARMINAKEGDRLRLSIEGPEGFSVSNTAEAAPNAQAQRMAFAGKRRPGGGWPAGVYLGRAEVVRDGAVVDAQSFTLSYD